MPGLWHRKEVWRKHKAIWRRIAHHTQIGEGDLIRWCEKCLPWIGEVQIADNPGRCEPGTGEINYHGVAKALNEMGYRGPVGMEAFASGDADAALEAFRNAFTI